MNRFQDVLRALRPTQWTKNAVVLSAFCFAFGDRNQILTSDALYRILAAGGLFCLASSGIYLINDLRDLESDRVHPVKRQRPLAAGKISIELARWLAVALLTVALTASFSLSRGFGAVVTLYIGMQIAYSVWLKQVALVDVFIIALGFVMRAVGGGVAINVTLSPWLLICAFLLALFLALCKRRHEKNVLSSFAENHRANLEYYHSQLLDQLIAIVSAATITSYSVYTLATDTVQKFGTSMLSLTIPFVIFGIFRYLDLVYRGNQGGRPEKTLLTDVILMIDLLLYGICVMGVFIFTQYRHHPV